MPGLWQSLPRGRVTFVMTDVEGSTRLLRRAGEDYAALLQRHRVLLERTWAAWRGVEVDREGDGSLVAFASADHALAACAEAQGRIEREPWPVGMRFRVRMGVHTGLAAPRGRRYVALAVHQVARVTSAAHGGQVIVTADTAAAASPAVAGALAPLGRFRVRDFDAPVPLLQLTGHGLPGTFPAVRALPAEGHNLPRPLDALVDRDAELARLAELLPAARLVTLVGTGGVGKTRLAVEAGQRAVPGWPGGVWFVDLAPLPGPDAVAAAVAVAVGVAGVPGAEPWQDVVEHLRRERALLVVDNCEVHREEVARLVADLLSACPGVHVLATSREPLHVPGERLLRLAPLAVPERAGRDVAPAEALAAPAVRLFVERARAVQPDFDPDPAAVACVVDICRRLDGLPLALEIAAARIGVLQPADVLAGIRRSLRILRSGDTTQPRRQRTLDDLLDWSVRLLTAEERLALARCAVLGGAFGVEAATAAVAGDPADEGDLGGDPDGGVDEYLVPELVWSLAEKSLLVAAPTAGGTRYRLLQTVRDHARALAAPAEQRATARRLARWYLDRLGPEHLGGQRWVSSVAAELDNVRSVVAQLAGGGDGDGAIAQELAVVLGRYHEAVQQLREGVTETTRLAAELTAATPARVALLTALADLHLRVGELDAAERVVAEAGALRTSAGAPDWDDVGLDKAAGELAIRRRRYDHTVALAERALAADPSLRGRARMHNVLGFARFCLGDADGARKAFAGELSCCEQLGDEVLLAHAHGNLAEIELRAGSWAAAARHQRACLELALELGQQGMLACTLNVAARLAAEGGDGPDVWGTVVRLGTKADDMLRESGLVLYDEDREVTERALASARGRLGTSGFEAQQAAGHVLDVAEAVRDAERVLADVEAATSTEARAFEDGVPKPRGSSPGAASEDAAQVTS
ncbi:hypothetical protein [Kineococcus glutinatus]|uniref:Guanylate cyclase domain-containing protein n=1 Tax=Kineococcus glutinatus TaxID=1070872 RepID=A0ABP9HGR9_9ACTN